MRVLIIGHASATEQAVEAARAASPTAAIHVLAYGRAASDAPMPADVRSLALPAGAPASLLPWLRDLRRARFDVAVVAQPRLGLSRARGALLGLAFATGAPRLLALDLHANAFVPVRRRTAGTDAVRFAGLNGAGYALAPVVARLLELLGSRIGKTKTTPKSTGTVAYLRTDLDLALAPLAAGGSLAHTQGIVQAIERRGHGVQLWTSGDLVGLPAHLEQRRLPVALRANVPWELAELGSGLLQASSLRSRPKDAAFVYQRYSLNNLAGVIAARRWGVPLVLEANASEVTWREQWASLQFPRLARATEQLVLASADRVAAVSENAAVDLRAVTPADGRLRVVPNGVDIKRFAGVPPRQLPFGADAFVVVFSGLFYPWHGTRFLAMAFPRLLAERPNARLLLVGDGEDAPLVRSLLTAELASGSALITGLVPSSEVPGYLAAADVLVSPHAADQNFIGSPIKLWEYMAAGRAIVATKVAQLGEVLRDRETALLVDPGDPESLAGALLELHDDPALRTRLGEAAGAEAVRLHSWDARLDTTLQ